MNFLPAHDEDPLCAFVASTRRLATLLDDLDPEALDRGMRRQLDAFEALESAVSRGVIGQSGALVAAIDEARRTFGAVSGRQVALREELGGLRNARARTLRRPGTDAAAQFVSRRV